MPQQLKDKPARVTGLPSRRGSVAGQTDKASKPVLAVWVVFGQTLHHEFVNYDDDEYVYDNSIVTQGFNFKP